MKQGHTRWNPVRAALAALLVVGCAWLALAAQAVAAPGQIGYDGCLASDAAGGLRRPARRAARRRAAAVAVSPDGRSVYVASVNSVLDRALLRQRPEGQVAYDGCVASRAPRAASTCRSGRSTAPTGWR